MEYFIHVELFLDGPQYLHLCCALCNLLGIESTLNSQSKIEIVLDKLSIFYQ